jgi:hypothetical protein
MCPVAASVLLAITITMQEAKLEAQLAAFPPREVVEAQFKFASIHEEYLLFMTEMLPSEKNYKILLDYHSQVHCYWLALRIAQDKMQLLPTRCRFLKLLKESLDAATHLRGRMPPLVCIWRFREGPPPLGCYPAPLHNKTGTGTVSKPEPQ